MWRVVVPRSDENSTLLSSDITAGAVAPGHLTSLSGPSGPHGPHHWGYPPPPHPSYQPQHPDLRHHHDMRHGPGPGDIRPEIRHEMQRHQPELRHDITGIRNELTELRPSHELPELKNDVTELRTQEQVPQTRGMKRAMSDSDCDDVFSEESGKEP